MATASRPFPASADYLDPRLAVEQHAEARAHHRVVAHDHHPDGHDRPPVHREPRRGARSERGGPRRRSARRRTAPRARDTEQPVAAPAAVDAPAPSSPTSTPTSLRFRGAPHVARPRWARSRTLSAPPAGCRVRRQVQAGSAAGTGLPPISEPHVQPRGPDSPPRARRSWVESGVAGRARASSSSYRICVQQQAHLSWPGRSRPAGSHDSRAPRRPRRHASGSLWRTAPTCMLITLIAWATMPWAAPGRSGCAPRATATRAACPRGRAPHAQRAPPRPRSCSAVPAEGVAERARCTLEDHRN